MNAADRLGAELSAAQELGQVFAVIDAAHFEYLQDTLHAERLNFDPLFLDEVDNASVASGPHLVYVTGPKQIARLRAIVGDKPACVWWIWHDQPGAAEALRRHLRGLNMAEIPRDRVDNKESERTGGFETVLFRHADPNTIAALIAVASPRERQRIFGDAIGIVVDAPELDVVETLRPAETSSPTSRAMLRIGAESYAQLADYALRRQWNRATEGETIPEGREAPLFETAIDWIRREDVRDGPNIRYVFLMTIKTDGGFLTAAPIRDLMREAGGHSDVALSILRRQHHYGER